MDLDPAYLIPSPELFGKGQLERQYLALPTYHPRHGCRGSFSVLLGSHAGPAKQCRQIVGIHLAMYITEKYTTLFTCDMSASNGQSLARSCQFCIFALCKSYRHRILALRRISVRAAMCCRLASLLPIEYIHRSILICWNCKFGTLKCPVMTLND